MPITRRHEKAAPRSQLVALQFIIRHLRDVVKNFSVLSQGTYRQYQLH
jgi:hypothetical protein